MGNIITNSTTNNPHPDNQLNTSTNTINTNSNTILGDYIYSWALNYYSINSLSPNSWDRLYHTDQLKKRACCTKSTAISIGLPGLSSSTPDNIFNTSPNQLLLDQYRVTIPIFSQSNMAESCKKLQSTYGIKSPSFLRQDNLLADHATSDCQNFYGNFCQEVRKNRKTYSNIIIDQLYGPYPDPTMVALQQPQNAYVDCNCENSFIKILDGYIPPSTPTTPNITADTGAQMIDYRCANNVGDKAWINKDERIKELCISNMQIGDITATDRAKINITQICELTNGKDDTTSTVGSVAASANSVADAIRALNIAINAAADAAGKAAAAAAIAAGASPSAVTAASDAAATAAADAVRNGGSSSDAVDAGKTAGANALSKAIADDLRASNKAAQDTADKVHIATVGNENVKISSSNTTTIYVTPEPKKNTSVLNIFGSIIGCIILLIILNIIRKRYMGNTLSTMFSTAAA